MAKKKQNISITGPLSWQTIKAYLAGELSGKEMYNLERKTQNEPFEQEAFDGFYDHAPASMENDLNDLRKKIERKTGNTLKSHKADPFSINWKLVASIAALIILIPLAIIILTRSPKSNSELAQTITPKETKQPSPAIEDAFSGQALASDTLQAKELTPAGTPVESMQKSAPPVRRQQIEQADDEVMVILEKQTLDKRRILALTEQKEKALSSDKPEITETIRSVDLTSLPPVSSETVGASPSSASSTTRPVLSRIPARPPGGMEGYKAYLKSQLLYYSGNIKGTFIISLKVKENGEVKDVVIKDGSTRRTNKKLQSIVEKAPGWIPASEKGKKIEDTATFELILD